MYANIPCSISGMTIPWVPGINLPWCPRLFASAPHDASRCPPVCPSSPPGHLSKKVLCTAMWWDPEIVHPKTIQNSIFWVLKALKAEVLRMQNFRHFLGMWTCPGVIFPIHTQKLPWELEWLQSPWRSTETILALGIISFQKSTHVVSPQVLTHRYQIQNAHLDSRQFWFSHSNFEPMDRIVDCSVLLGPAEKDGSEAELSCKYDAYSTFSGCILEKALLSFEITSLSQRSQRTTAALPTTYPSSYFQKKPLGIEIPSFTDRSSLN